MKISEIKKDARIKLTGNYIKACSSSLLYFIMISLLTFFQAKLANHIENSVLLSIVQAIFLLINWILGYGIIANILDLTDGKTTSITDFINSTLKNCAKYTKIGLIILLKILIPLALTLLAAFYWFGTAVAKVHQTSFLCFNKDLLPLASCIWIFTILILIYYILKHVLVAYIYHEHPDMSEKEIVAKSKELMHSKKHLYILLLLSFLHWFLLAALIIMTLNIFIEGKYLTPFIVFFYSVIRPYIIVSKNEFYRELEDIKVEKAEREEIKEN